MLQDANVLAVAYIIAGVFILFGIVALPPLMAEIIIRLDYAWQRRKLRKIEQREREIYYRKFKLPQDQMLERLRQLHNNRQCVICETRTGRYNRCPCYGLRAELKFMLESIIEKKYQNNPNH